MGDSITEGTIVKWHKAVGQQVEMDEILCEVETDKVRSSALIDKTVQLAMA
jgi:2-oxoglutarate dehydrogenase E2 component (dihydrolipoamide succinyltransferase)